MVDARSHASRSHDSIPRYDIMLCNQLSIPREIKNSVLERNYKSRVKSITRGNVFIIHGNQILLTGTKLYSRERNITCGAEFDTRRNQIVRAKKKYYSPQWPITRGSQYQLHSDIRYIHSFWQCLTRSFVTYCSQSFVVLIYVTMTDNAFTRTNPHPPLQWHHNECDGVSNHQPHDCLLNRLFRRRSMKTSKLRVIGLCVGEFTGYRWRWISRTKGQ